MPQDNFFLGARDADVVQAIFEHAEDFVAPGLRHDLAIHR